MITDAERMRLKKLFSDTISLLCRSGVPGGVARRVDALIGVTFNNREVVLVNFSEDFRPENGIAAGNEIAEGRNVDEARSSMTQENSNASNAYSYDIKTDHDDVKDEFVTGQNPFATGQVMYNHSALVPDAGFEDNIKPINSFQDSIENMELLHYTDSADQNCYEADGFQPESVGKISSSESDSDCLIVKAEIQEDAAQVNSLPVEGENLIASSSAKAGTLSSVPAFRRSSYASLSTRMKRMHNTQRYARRSTFGYKFSWPQQKYYSISEPSSQVSQFRNDTVSSSMRQSDVGPTDNLPPCGAPASGNDTIVIAVREQLQCFVCGAWLRGRQTLNEHIRGMHLSIYNYHCKYCGLSFKWRSALRNHQLNCSVSQTQ